MVSEPTRLNVMKNRKALILGLSTNGLTVVRALGKEGISLVILEKSTENAQPHLKTKYGNKEFIDELVGRSLIDWLIKKSKDKFVLFPTTDYQVSWLSQNRQSLPENAQLMFPILESVTCLLDKEIFYKFCIRNNFPIKKQKLFSNKSSFDQLPLELTFPVIVKTKEKIYKKGIKKAYIVNSFQEFKKLWADISFIHHEFIVQEYQPGGDQDIFFCLQYISPSGTLLGSFTGHKIRQWLPLCGGTASCKPAYAPELHDLTFEIFKKAGFHGIGSIEYKRDLESGTFFIIEPTVCRTDFQEGVAVANGVNIPYLAFQDASGQKQNPVIKNGGRYIWVHGLFDRLAADYYIANKKLTKIQWFWSLRNARAFDLLSVDDPQPFIESIKRKILNRIRHPFLSS